MRSLIFLALFCLTIPSALRAQTDAYPSGAEDRATTVAALRRIALPVMRALAENRLKIDFPLGDWDKKRHVFTYHEAFARTLCGLAPWLELGPDDTPEGLQRAELIALTLRATHNVFDPAAPDYLDFSFEKDKSQNLVEAAFISLGLLRAPRQLWDKLSAEDHTRISAMLTASRSITPGSNNWVLFPATVEAALWTFTGKHDPQPIVRALNDHKKWYLGDGTYGDGPVLRWDYYNSYVIHPMMLEVLRVCRDKNDQEAAFYRTELKRAQRYAVVQERMISPEGTFPVIGRSSVYRLASLQLLSSLILSDDAPKIIATGSTRSALTAIIRRFFETKGTFDERGWLQPGVIGHQPKVADAYISTGSLYLTTAGFLHLGLPANHSFWTQPGGPWTQRRIWTGDPDVQADHAVK